MNNEELLQKVLNSTIERFARQTINHEAEVANLHSQIFILSDQIEELSKKLEEKQVKNSSSKE